MQFRLDLRQDQMEELRRRITENDYIEQELTSKEGITIYLYLDVAEPENVHCVAVPSHSDKLNQDWWHLAMSRSFELFVFEELADESN